MNGTASIASLPAVIEMADAAIGSLYGATQVVAEGVNWSVAPGEFWVVAGAPYSGKSDLLMHAAGLMAPLHGSCRVWGCETTAFGEAQLAKRLRVGFVFTGGKLFDQLTIAENVALPLRYHRNLTAAAAAKEIEPLLELLELQPLATRAPASLGADWRQRAALARALALRPELLLLDNPITSLGGRQRLWLIQFLNQLWHGHPWMGGRPMTLVVTADDLRVWPHARRRYAVLDKKQFTALGEWRAVEASPLPIVKDLLAEPQETAV